MVGGYPIRPSDFLKKAQYEMYKQVYRAPDDDPIHHAIFATAYKDRIETEGHRRGMKFPYWIGITTRRYSFLNFGQLILSLDHTSFPEGSTNI